MPLALFKKKRHCLRQAVSRTFARSLKLITTSVCTVFDWGGKCATLLPRQQFYPFHFQHELI
jgi:hypothetical protein